MVSALQASEDFAERFTRPYRPGYNMTGLRPFPGSAGIPAGEIGDGDETPAGMPAIPGFHRLWPTMFTGTRAPDVQVGELGASGGGGSMGLVTSWRLGVGCRHEL